MNGGFNAGRNLVLRYVPIGVVLLVILAFIFGMNQITPAPTYTSRATVFIGSNTPSIQIPELALLGRTAIEDQLAVLESESIRRYATDKLHLVVKPVPMWEPNPAFYQIKRVLAILTGGRRPIDYAKLSYPAVDYLEFAFEKAGKKDIWIQVDGKGSYTLFVDGKSLDTKPVGERLTLDGLSIALSGFTSGVEQKWQLKMTDPERATRRLFENVTVLRLGATSNTIGLRSVDAHPELAARIVSTMMEFFMERDKEIRRTTASDQLEYIEKQIEMTKTEQEELLYAIRETLSDTAGKLVGDSAQEVRRLYLEQEKELAYLRNSRTILKNLYEHAVGDQSFIGYLTEGLPVEIETNVLSSIVAKERALAQARETKTENHPDVIKLRTDLEMQREQLNSMVEDNLKLLDTRISQSDKKLARYSKLLDASPETSTELTRLLGDVEIRTKSIGELYAQRQIANLHLISNDSPIKVLDAAVPYRIPTSPRLILVAASSFVAALLLTIALLFAWQAVDPRLYVPADIEARFGAPVLAVLSESGELEADEQAVRLGLKIEQILVRKDGKLGVFTAASIDKTEIAKKAIVSGLKAVGNPTHDDFDSRFIAIPGCGTKALYSPELKDAAGVVLVVTPGKRRLSEVSGIVSEIEALDYSLVGWIYIGR